MLLMKEVFVSVPVLDEKGNEIMMVNVSRSGDKVKFGYPKVKFAMSVNAIHGMYNEQAKPEDNDTIGVKFPDGYTAFFSLKSLQKAGLA